MLVTPILNAGGTSNPDVLYRNTLQRMQAEEENAEDAPPEIQARYAIRDPRVRLKARTKTGQTRTIVRDSRAPGRRRPSCGRPPAWLRPSIPLNPQSPWYAVMECEHIMPHGAGFLRVVAPAQSALIGKKIYVPAGYLNYPGTIYVGHCKVKDPGSYSNSTPMEEREVITVLPSLHYGWDFRVPRAHRIAPPPWATADASMSTDFGKPAPPPRHAQQPPMQKPPHGVRIESIQKPTKTKETPESMTTSALSMSTIGIVAV